MTLADDLQALAEARAALAFQFRRAIRDLVLGVTVRRVAGR